MNALPGYMGMTFAYAFTGSFCTHKSSLDALAKLIAEGATVIPVFSDIVYRSSTRFGKADDLIGKVETLCGRSIIRTIEQAESEITRGNIACVIVSPCTGNTLAKIANAITDTAVTMTVKAQLRNRRPVLLALATNDALGSNLKNIGICNDKKHIYFVPMRQDDSLQKPTSLVCDFSMLSDALDKALSEKQVQPLFIM